MVSQLDAYFTVQGYPFIEVDPFKERIGSGAGIVLVQDRKTREVVVRSTTDLIVTSGALRRGELGKPFTHRYPKGHQGRFRYWCHFMTPEACTQRSPRRVAVLVERTLGDCTVNQRNRATGRTGHLGVRVFTYLPTSEFFLYDYSTQDPHECDIHWLIKTLKLTVPSEQPAPLRRFLERYQQHLRPRDFTMYSASGGLGESRKIKYRINQLARQLGPARLLTPCLPPHEWTHPAFKEQ